MSNDRYNTRNNRKISMMSPVGLASPLGDENRYNDFNSRAFNSPMPVFIIHARFLNHWMLLLL